MLYKIQFQPGVLHSLTGKKNRGSYEIYICGKLYIDYKNKGIYESIQGAKKSIFITLKRRYRYFYYYKYKIKFTEEELNTIIKEIIGTDPSYPVYIKEIK